ncbi:hypothetical protein R6Z07M_008945 [Ovis aries]
MEGFLSIQYQLEEAPASHVRRRMSGSNQREPWRAEEIPQLLPAHHFQCLTSISTEELAGEKPNDAAQDLRVLRPPSPSVCSRWEKWQWFISRSTQPITLI